MDTCFEDLEIKIIKQKNLFDLTPPLEQRLNPIIIHTCDEEFFGESTAVKGGNFLLQDYDKYPENTEMECVL